jgi:hypothetical protein
MARFEVGEGTTWHIHKDHVKYHSSDNSRVNFSGSTAAKVIAKVKDNVDRYNLPTVDNYYDECIDWINTYV